MSAIDRLLWQVDWASLNYLVIDIVITSGAITRITFICFIVPFSVYYFLAS